MSVPVEGPQALFAHRDHLGPFRSTATLLVTLTVGITPSSSPGQAAL
ncbi:hypothetical protein ACWEQ2_02310 [Streptomyces sp. NPDC004096]